MGGTTFEQYQDGADVARAYAEACEIAGYEHGHGGYSGTIQECDGYVVIQHNPVSYDEAIAVGNQLINADDPRISDKWGPAGAIPVCKDGSSALVEKTFKVRTGTYDGDWQKRERELKQIAMEKFKLTSDQVLGVTVVADVPGPARVTSNAPQGKTVMRYTITNTQHRTWDTGLLSQAEARKKATELADAQRGNWGSDVVNYEVEGVTRRVDGQPLVRVQRTISRHDLEVKVTYRKQAATATGSKPITGWYFFGWASC